MVSQIAVFYKKFFQCFKSQELNKEIDLHFGVNLFILFFLFKAKVFFIVFASSLI